MVKIKFSQLGNDTLIDAISKELPQSTFYWMLISLVLAVVWIVYLTYYNSRVMGLILTAILNRFVKVGHVKFGSFSFSVLSGKIMFRDVHLITVDFSIRIQLGMAIFRWWRPLTTKTISEDLIHEETRLSVYLDSFELHVYNRSETYARLEELFGLEKKINLNKDEDKGKKKEKKASQENTEITIKNKWLWRTLVPVIKVEISSGRIVFGNYLVPTTLSVNFGDSHFLYSTKQASTPFDFFMHIVKGKMDNIRIMMVPSPKYKPQEDKIDEPPRYMGDGFVVFQSQKVEIYYFRDEPGFVPYEVESLQMANGDILRLRTWPVWGVEVKCDKMTDISYGPWADRQREYLWRFFFPPDYQTMQPTKLPEPGDVRIWKNFDFKMSLQNDASIDILFTKNKETQALHMNCKKGSYLEFTIPWIIDEHGYQTKISSLLIALDTTTSLSFRSLLECETLQVDVEANFPRHWNDHQTWQCDIRASKATLSLIYHHKHFFVDLVDDWSSKSVPDVYRFVPYTWKVNVILQEFELITLTNQWNWIDCHGATPENAHLAVCGDTFDLSFTLPFDDFLPPLLPIKIFIRGEAIEVRLYLAETNTSFHFLQALADNCRRLGRDGNIYDGPLGYQNNKKWRRITHRSSGWVDCWLTPIVALSINYTYHPVAPVSKVEKYMTFESLSTPDAEEMLLIPLRLNPVNPFKQKMKHLMQMEFDPTEMDADEISVELEVGPSEICIYGALLKNLWHVKENYFGDDQKFTDFKETAQDANSLLEHILARESNNKPIDPRRYRPLHIRVQVVLHDLHGHLMKHCNEGDPPCPSIFLERLCFEMDKRYTETKLQVMLSPVVVYIRDSYEKRPSAHSHLKDGHLVLSALQIRGNAMFSHRGLPLDSETLEYCWLLEVTIGDLVGRLTAPQLQALTEGLQTLAFGIEDAENNLQHAKPFKLCQHGLPQSECTFDPSNSPCITSDDIKYRMTRVTMDCVDLYLVESGTALNIQIYPIRLSTCNLHGRNNKAGITALVPNVKVKQFVLSIPVDDPYNSQTDIWLEAGGVCFGPVNVDAAMALPGPEFHHLQDQFLKLHDEKTHRLWFLWPKEDLPKNVPTHGKCGCVGGCAFFGTNRNGPHVFHPSDSDFQESLNSAVYHVCPEEVGFGFGQSLLQKGQLIFTANSGMSTFPMFWSQSRVHSQLPEDLSSHQESDINMEGNSTLVNVSPPSKVDSTADQNDKESQEKTKESLKPEDSFLSECTLVASMDLGNVREKSASLASSSSSSLQQTCVPGNPVTHVSSDNAPSDSVPSDYMPDSSIPDAYDTDRYVSTPSDVASWPSVASGSSGSLPDITTSQKDKGHERKLSDQPPVGLRHGQHSEQFQQQKQSPQQQPASGLPGSINSSVSSESRRSSKNSIPSLEGTSGSRHSSLTSPVLRRLSSQLSFQREGSIPSMTGSGSERFFSAAEDLTSSVQTLNSYIQGADLTSPFGSIQYPQGLGQTGSAFSDTAAAALQQDHSCSPENVSLSSSYYGDIDSPHSSMYVHQEQSESDNSSQSSHSSGSFVSAVSSQEASHHSINQLLSGSSSPTINADDQETILTDECDPELDVNLPMASNYVNLHGQMNKPITKSVLLIQCYTRYMMQLKCSYWSAPPPLSSHMLQCRASENGQAPESIKQSTAPLSDMVGKTQAPAWIPHFSYLNDGFTPKLMVNKKEMKSPPSLSPPNGATARSGRSRQFFPSEDQIQEEDADSLFTYENHVSKTTAIVNLKGSIDIMVSPLMVEALQRYLEAVTPVLQSLHPSTIVDAMHFKVVSSVKAQNKLKQEEDNGDMTEKKDEKEKNIQKEQNQEDLSVDVDDLKSKTSRLQVMFSLSRVNICFMQASLVEELVSISALDHAQDLTCVSLLSACLDNISCQLLMNNISQKTLKVMTESSPDSSTKKNQMKPGSPRIQLFKETSVLSDSGENQRLVERQQEDMVGSLSVSRVHLQLRRMKHGSNSLNNIYLTAIPEYRSKVLFTFEKPNVPLGGFTGTGTLAPHAQTQTGAEESGPRTREFDQEGAVAEDVAGFIMFECGLEDISLRAARRTGYADATEAQESDDGIQQVKEHMEFMESASHCFKNEAWKDTSPTSESKQTNSPSDGNGTSENSGNTADDEASGPSGQGKENTDKMGDGSENVTGRSNEPTHGSEQEFHGDASSAVLQVKSVWFNFAAPPPSLKKKKLEYTRYDWNLLSTATPAINAWMNPTHHVVMAAKTLIDKLNERICVVMACMMTEGPETSGIHNRVKSKVNKLTSLSSTLQEDPSCQLLTALRRYIKKVGVKVIEESVRADAIPQLVTIKKGLLVMTRQWKTILYMPRQVADNNFKSKRKIYSVNFTLPQDKSLDHISPMAAVDEWDTSADNFMVVDEKTSLLKAEGESVHTPSVYSIPACPVGSEAVKGDPHSQTPFFKQISKQKSSNPSQLSGSINSLSSADQPGTLPSAPDTPHRQSLTGHLSELDRGSGKDIGSWMRQQQQYVAEHYQQGFYGYPSMGQDSLTNAGLSEYSHDESMSLAPCIMHPAVQIQDAQVLFKPLLKAIGLQTEAVKMSAVMMKFGGNISVRSHLDTLQVEIIDSEMRSIAKSKGKGKGRGKRAARLLIATGTDKPAFQTHALAFMVDMKDIIDFEKSKQEKKESDLIEMHQKSLRTLKLMMDEMEAKPTTTQVNFSFNCNSVMQHINMPLLRLVHQFVTMIENIHKTQKELREQASNVYTRHKKQDSKGSSTETGTDIHSIDQLEEEHPPTSDLSTNVQTPMSSDVPSPAARPSNLPLKVSVSDQPVRPNVLGSGTSKAHKLSWRKSKHESLHSKQNYSDFKEDMLNSPIHSIDSVTIDMVDTSSPALAEKTIVDQICESTPVCWIKLYHILNLYSTMPDMKMVTKKPSQSRLSVIAEESEKASQNQSGAKPDSVNEKETGKDLEAIERQPRKDGRMYSKSTFKHSLLIGGEQVPLIVFGIAKLQRIKITAVLSGLTLEADLQNVHGSATHREKVKGVPKKKSRETSASAHVGHAMVALIEGNAPDLQTIVAINISQSHGLYSSISKRSHEFNSGLLTVGCIDVDIPQHPVALHGVVARSSKRLSCTLQEFIRVPSKSKSVSHDTPDGSIPTQPASKHSELSDYMSMSTQPKDVLPSKPVVPQQPLTIHFKAILKGLTVGASLLPSLKAEYKMGTVFSSGITGKKPRFTLDLPVHSLSFESKISTPSNLPSSASVVLPPIHVHGDYKEHAKDPACRNEGLAEGLTLREGPYLNAVAEVGAFEHSLTTDLLNHLVFVQKVFMKEVNELVQKVSGADKPVPLWPEESVQARKGVHKPLLYHFRFRLKGIQITATTPTDNAVRLETDMIELELSNRVLSTRHGIHPTESNYKVFVKAQVDLNVALGTLMKNPLFDEAEPDFPQLASFNTTISLRNALQEELIPGVSKDQEALLISLKRPIVFIQPAAFDKAVLVWLNYKNAYEYWNEQRMVLNKEIQKATQQFIDRLPLSSIAHSSTSTLGTLYLQLTVDDLGICLPANPFPQGVTTTSKVLEEPGASLVLTLQQTQISACSYGSLVSKGKFTGFCLRFDEDFEKSWDDWKPNNSDKIVMNAMVVPEGTYEVCSRTINPQANDKNSNAKVILNVKWHMKGLDVNMDTNIGKRLSQLGNTLTSLTSDPDVYFSDSLSHQDHDLRKLDDPNTICEELLNTDYGADMNSKQWTRLIEKKMNDQAKVVEDLKQLGASQNTIEIEERKLRDLKVAVCHDFRQEFMKKLRSKSAKASALRDKLGLGYKPSQVAKPKGFPSHAGYHRTMTYDVRKLATYKEESDKELFLQDSSHKHGRALSLGAQKFSTPKSTWDHSQHSIQSDYTSKTEESPPTTPPYITLRDDTSSGSDDSDPDLAFYKSTSFRPRAHSDSRSQNIPSPSQGSGGSQKTHEPNVDFELDVKVQVDSGMCVLHPKEIRQEGDSERLKGVRSQKDLHQVSPQPEHKKLKKKYVTESLLGSRQHQPQPLSNVTTFVLPGVDVKVHWNSKTSSTMHEVGDVSVASSTGPDTGDTHLTPGGSGTGVTTTSKKTPQKKASLYAWLSLQQLPEMLIRPVLLDFLEQALESIPIVLSKNSSKNSTLRTPIQQASVDLDNSASSLVSSASYSSFPVDVVVYLQVKPSLIRFTCLPVSRVECLLRLPSLDVVFSTKKADFDEATLSETSVSSKSKVGMRLSSSTSNLGLRSGKTPNVMRSASGHQQEILTTSGGGLSVTACLADFSLYVFHPYGGGHKERSLSALENKFKKNRGADGSHSNATNVGRKDSLSLNVEFVKVNLSRSRKGVLQADLLPSGSSTKLGGVETSTKAANSVRFSAVCDVGSASFKYDMRRLSEILALPKAWYRRALARRMFLGEERAVVDSEEEDDDDVSLSSSPSPESPLFSPYGRAQTFNTVHYPNEKPTNHRRVASADRNMPETSELKRGFLDYSSRPHHATGSAPQSPGEDRQRVAQSMVPPSTPSMLPLRVQQEYVRMRERDLQPQGYLRPSSQFTAPVTLSLSQQKSVRDWETLVLFAVNLSRLDVIINMSNVMGNTVWSTKDLKCEGSVSMDSTGAKNMTITAGLGGSKLEAKGGIVGGTIALQTLHSSVSIKEEPSNEPVHRAGFQLETLETRIDYMGSSILMGRTSKLCVELKDEWKIQACRMDDSDPDMVATRRPATIFVFGELEWDKFHLMISRSTTPDLIKMVAKIEEFFVQQLNSSKRVLSAFGPMPGSGKAKKKKDNEEASWISEIRHHRHWQNVLEHVSGCKLSMLSFTLPSHRSTVGGSMSLKGHNLSLACFHGINFRSKSWGLFTMDEPYIVFNTEAQEVVDDDGAKCTHVEQTLQFHLGHEHRDQHIVDRKDMAMVCKLSRGHYMPPSMTNIQDWFHYALATSEIRDLDSFPQMAREGSESPQEHRMSSRRGQEYNHDTEVIFVLPRLLMVLKTRHLQGEHEPAEDDPKPKVECSFVTDFYHHINVAMDAEAILFIHDLVTSYVREKDKGASRMPKSPETERKEKERKNVSNPTAVLKQDYREFQTISWRLEPTVNLLTWAGKKIDPVGVDFILQKLGFQHARLTIPKWMQRGCMDPLDKMLSVLVNKLVLLLKEHADNEDDDDDDSDNIV